MLARALQDAATLVEGGAAGAIVENLGDAPFEADRVEPHVVSMLAVVTYEIHKRWGDSLAIGVNVLRNDALGALAAASASGATFIRVNVHVGAMLTDQGVITGRARETLLYRNRVAPGVGVAADLLVKHAAPLAELDLGQLARDTVERGGAEALIVTGSGTGEPASHARLREVRTAVPGAPLWVGSGVTPDNAGSYGELADLAIVGTALHQDGDLSAPLELERVRAVVEAFRRPTLVPAHG